MKLFAVAVWWMLAITAVYAMFHVTFKVDEVAADLHGLDRQILKEREAVHVLEAEWAYLNDPARLEELATNLLPWLQPVDTPQIQPIDALPRRGVEPATPHNPVRSEEHTSELQSLMRNSYAVFCLKKKNKKH